MFGPVINLFYPALCLLCGKKIEQWNQNLCKDCIKRMEERRPPFCIKCGRQLNGGPDIIDTCFDCKTEDFYFDKAHSSCLYDEAIKTLVHYFKYKKEVLLAKEFTDIMLGFMEKYGAGKSVDLVLPIPMHPKKIFKREINPSEVLAKNIAKRLKVNFSKTILRKIKDTPAQSKLARSKRIRNVTGSFGLHNASRVKGLKILLIDDLFTSGSTVNECAKLLKKAGASFVEVVTLARGDERL